jgi:hypothetical protein
VWNSTRLLNPSQWIFFKDTGGRAIYWTRFSRGLTPENPNAVVDTESRVPPGEQISGKLAGKQLFFREETYHSAF